MNFTCEYFIMEFMRGWWCNIVHQLWKNYIYTVYMYLSRELKGKKGEITCGKRSLLANLSCLREDCLFLYNILYSVCFHVLQEKFVWPMTAFWASCWKNFIRYQKLLGFRGFSALSFRMSCFSQCSVLWRKPAIRNLFPIVDCFMAILEFILGFRW